MKDGLISVVEAARRIGVHRFTINTYYKDGKLPYGVINNRAYFKVEDVDKLRPGRSVSPALQDNAASMAAFAAGLEVGRNMFNAAMTSMIESFKSGRTDFPSMAVI